MLTPVLRKNLAATTHVAPVDISWWLNVVTRVFVEPYTNVSEFFKHRIFSFHETQSTAHQCLKGQLQTQPSLLPHATHPGSHTQLLHSRHTSSLRDRDRDAPRPLVLTRAGERREEGGVRNARKMQEPHGAFPSESRVSHASTQLYLRCLCGRCACGSGEDSGDRTSSDGQEGVWKHTCHGIRRQ